LSIVKVLIKNPILFYDTGKKVIAAIFISSILAAGTATGLVLPVIAKSKQKAGTK
jgi:hypothetical protein